MKKMFLTSLLLFLSSAFKGLKSDHNGQMEIARLRMSLMYVQSIKTFRLLFMSILSMGICLIFFLAGLILLHVSLFVYAPWSMVTKMTVGLLFSLVYLSAAVVMVARIFASDKWLKIFNADAIIDGLRKEAGQDQPNGRFSQTS